MPRNHCRIRRIIGVTVLVLLLLPAVALAAPDVANEVKDVPPTNHQLAFSAIQFWILVIGSLTPLVGYLLNTYGSWISEPVKAGVQVAVAALASLLFQLLSAGDLALNAQTLQLCFSAVVAALVAHKFLWLPSGVGQVLGAGVNKNLATKP